MGIAPRHTLTKPRSWMGLFFDAGGIWAVLAALFVILVTWFSVISYGEAQAFEEDGVETPAVIVALRKESRGDGVTFNVTFAYEANGQRFEDEQQVARSFYESVAVGDQTPIRYLNSAPERFEYYIGQNWDHGVKTQTYAAVAGLAGLGALWYFGGRANRAVLARRWGHRTTAKISGLVEGTNASGMKSGRGYMTWKLADGTQGHSLERDYEELRALGIGTEIIVYVRKGDSWWEGDVGPRLDPASNVPKVK